MYDVVILGAGVVGCALAQHMAKYRGSIAVCDRAPDVADGASKANSGIVHAGFDAHPGTEKARLNVKGAGMYKALCEALGVPYGQPGALVLGFTEDDRHTLGLLLKQGEQNGVPGLDILERDEIVKMEQNVNPAVSCALYAPTSGLVSPYELTCALASSAAENGVEFLLDTTATSLRHEDGAWVVVTDKGELRARAVVNCAGVGAGDLHNQISTRKVEIVPRRGEYYLLDRTEKPPFTMTMFQVPSAMGKGVLVSPTTHGNLLLGPSAEDIGDARDTATTRQGLDFVMDRCKRTWAQASTRGVITTFSGIRAHEVGGDFIIGAVEGAPEGAFEAIGIESPGLSAAPAIGQELGDWVAYSLKLPKNDAYIAPTPLPKPFSHMTADERRAAYQKDPEYGAIVCRCEQVTEAEIRASIRRPCGARTIDGVKRRTRAGMGRCQGGFCSPRVLEILCQELGKTPLEITKCGGNSYVLAGTLSDIAREAQNDGK